MVCAASDQFNHRDRARQARPALSENGGRHAGRIQEGARRAGGGGQGREKTVGWAKTLGANAPGGVPTTARYGGHVGGRVRVRRFCPPYKSVTVPDVLLALRSAPIVV